MYRALFTWWCNFTAEAGKTRRVYHVQHDLCQTFHNYAASLPCHTYFGRMKLRNGTALPPVSRQPYALAAKITHNSKAISIGQTVFKSNSTCVKPNDKITFCFIQMSSQQKDNPGLIDLAGWHYLHCDHKRHSNTVNFQLTFYGIVVYKLSHPLIFWGRILHFFSLKGMPCHAIEI